MEISGFLIKADYFSQFFPILSSVAKAVVIFLKIIVDISDRILPQPLDNRLVNYLRNQSYSKSFMIGIPVLGNAYAAFLVYKDFKKIPE